MEERAACTDDHACTPTGDSYFCLPTLDEDFTTISHSPPAPLNMEGFQTLEMKLKFPPYAYFTRFNELIDYTYSLSLYFDSEDHSLRYLVDPDDGVYNLSTGELVFNVTTPPGTPLLQPEQSLIFAKHSSINFLTK